MLLAGLPAGQKEHGQETMPGFDPDFLASRQVKIAAWIEVHKERGKGLGPSLLESVSKIV